MDDDVCELFVCQKCKQWFPESCVHASVLFCIPCTQKFLLGDVPYACHLCKPKQRPRPVDEGASAPAPKKVHLTEERVAQVHAMLDFDALDEEARNMHERICTRSKAGGRGPPKQPDLL